jgi:glycosyltransferase involved in cell wall biosynthesis
MSQSKNEPPKIAIVCDWLTNMGGAENVVLAFHEAFPNAPIYTSTYNPAKTPAFDGIDIRTTYLQSLPRIFRNLHKFMPMLRVKAFQKLDFSAYDIILSSSSAESKQIRKSRPGQIHICYCHTPIRYYWSHYNEYKANPGFGKLNWLVRMLMPIIVPSLKRADYKAAQNVDYFIGNSNTVKKRIEMYYKKSAEVIFPPVDTKRFNPDKQRGDFYMALARHIPYKRLDLAILAANELNVPLRVFGNGSERETLEQMAGPTVSFHEGTPSKKDQDFITKSFNTSRGYIFPAEEDFGISQVEAMAGGSPVIAFNKGGARDIVTDGETGVFFNEQSTASVVDAIKRVEQIKFQPVILNNRAKRFDKTLFIVKIKNFVQQSYEQSNARF